MFVPYRPLSGKVSTRVIDPYGLWYSYDEGTTFLTGYCHMRKTIRTFAVDARMIAVDLLKSKFVRDRQFDITRFAEESFGVIRGRDHIFARIQLFDWVANLFKAKQWSSKHTKMIPQSDGSVILEVKSEAIYELTAFVLKYGRYARALTPKELVDAVRDEAGAVLKTYMV